ncbi:MAG: response regulator, partial [Nitrospirae bacterium]|nr:response regulator [Nitrospirota bacterium]
DSGIGIPQEHLLKIFDPYFTTKQKGSGLGLSIVYSIIKNHHGDIDVGSNIGEGSTFHIYLPASSLTPPQMRESDEERHIDTIKGKVLLMDDADMVREVAMDMLNSLGFEVSLAKDGKEAVDIYAQARDEGSPFDVVIMDLTVPGGMGGIEAVKKLLAIDNDAKVIVSSGYAGDSVMAEFTKYGFKGAIPKPFRLWELKEAILKTIYSE